MSVGKYFSRHNVPFSIAQYYRYKQKLEDGGPDAIKDNRSKGNNRKLVTEAEGFLKGYLRSRPEVGLAELQDLLKERFKIRMSKSGVSKCLNRLGCVCQMKPVEEKVERSYTVSGGFELIIALALHLEWPKAVAEVISNRIQQIKQSNLWLEEEKGKDQSGRNKQGQFTAKYNKRKDVRTKRFDSIEDKREGKNFSNHPKY